MMRDQEQAADRVSPIGCRTRPLRPRYLSPQRKRCPPCLLTPARRCAAMSYRLQAIALAHDSHWPENRRAGAPSPPPPCPLRPAPPPHVPLLAATARDASDAFRRTP